MNVICLMLCCELYDIRKVISITICIRYRKNSKIGGRSWVLNVNPSSYHIEFVKVRK